jgi:hypothetical protein
MDQPSRGIYAAGFFVALLAFCSEVVCSVPLLFAPGWANGWPGGLTIHQVFSTGMTLVMFVMLMTIGIGAGCGVGFEVCCFRRGRRYAGRVVAVWVVVWAVLTVAACAWGYRQIYASAVEMWPRGYNAA